MSITHTYTAQPRTSLGKHASVKLRAAGCVPVTVSRRGKESQHLQLDVKQAENLVANVIHLCKVEVGGKSVTTLKGAVVRDCLKDYLQHIDLIEVDEKSEIKVDVSVVPDARNCPGVKAGGIVEQRLRKVKVKCPAGAIPDAIPLDLGAVQILQTVYAKSLTMPKGVTMVTNAKVPVLSVVIPRGLKKAEEAAAAATAEGAAAPAAAAAAKPGDAKAGDAKAADPKAAAKPADTKKK